VLTAAPTVLDDGAMTGTGTRPGGSPAPF
jgi:hypothetical protein